MRLKEALEKRKKGSTGVRKKRRVNEQGEGTVCIRKTTAVSVVKGNLQLM